MEGSDKRATIGTARNFAYRDEINGIPTSARVILSAGQEAKGVWRRNAQGTIEAERPAPWFQAAAAEGRVCVPGNLPDRESVQTGNRGSEVVPYPWITIAMDGARSTRNNPRLGCSTRDTPIESPLSGTGCVRGIASTSVRSSYLRSTVSEDRAVKEEAAAESSDALPANDMDVVPVQAHAPHSGVESMPDMSDSQISTDEDTKNEDSGALRLFGGPPARGITPAVPSPGVFIRPRNF